jgi:hypothetical protein
MKSGAEATLQEELGEVLASVRAAVQINAPDPDLMAAAGYLLHHLAGASARTGPGTLAPGGVIQFVEQGR